MWKRLNIYNYQNCKNERNVKKKPSAAWCCKTTEHDNLMNYKRWVFDNYTTVWHVPIGLMHNVLINWKLKKIAQKQN